MITPRPSPHPTEGELSALNASVYNTASAGNNVFAAMIGGGGAS